MNVSRHYPGLPFTWRSHSSETIHNDCCWLESIIKNSAPFSDGWVKARIVQLAYAKPDLMGSTPAKKQQKSAHGKNTLHQIPTYGAKKSEQEIVGALHSEYLNYCKSAHISQSDYFTKTVDENYVIRTLNRWRGKRFTEAISRNFEIYEDLTHPNIFLVTSTAPVSLYVDRQLPPSRRFRPLFNVDEFAQIVESRCCDRLTLRTHGYGTSAQTFYNLFMQEADALADEAPTVDRHLEDRHFYIGYHWPSEQPFASRGLWNDFFKNWGIVLKFAFVLSGFTGIVGTLLYGFLKLLGIPFLKAFGMLPVVGQFGQWSQSVATAEMALQWYWLLPTMFVLWVLLMQSLRVLVYQRDRYRAIHYGAPDLSEFFWRLDKACNLGVKTEVMEKNLALTPILASVGAETEVRSPLDGLTLESSESPIAVNLVGHSMGGLLLVNALRILSDRFGKDDRHIEGNDIDPQEICGSEIGERFVLDKLILASPDIPLEFLREGRNNYVRSAIRRCRQIYLMSSDRDIILRYLPTLSNWFSEPSIEMCGYRLGNVYLQPTDDCNPDCRYRPYIRNIFGSQPAATPTSAYDLFERFNYIDCSEAIGVNGIGWPLTPHRGLPIDLINAAIFLLSLSCSRIFGQVDLHGGYFFTHTPTFQILKLLMSVDSGSHEQINAGIERLIEGTPIRFLPNQPFLTEDK